MNDRIPLFPSLCSLSHHCWFVLYVCGRVVSLWNSGDGCVGWKGAWYLLSTHHRVVVCVSVVCVMAVRVLSCRIVLWVVEWRGGSCCLSSSSPCLPLSFPLLVGGVRGSARAALRARTLSPNTMCSLVVFSLFCSSSFFVPRLSCYCGMAVGDSPCVGVLCWHDGDG